MVVMAGNLTNDPVFSETQSGMSVVNFYMAANKRFRDKSGQLKEDACFIGVVAWNTLARSCRNKLQKGSTVLVTGELQSRKIMHDNGFINSVEIKARKIQFLDIFRDHEDSTDNDEFDMTENQG